MTTLSTLPPSLMTWIAGLSQAFSRSPGCHRQTWMRLSTLSSQGRRVALMDSLLRLSRHCRLPPGGLSGIESCRSSMGDIGGTLEQSWFPWISLVPKIVAPRLLRHFRPIRVCTTFQKLLAKTLLMRVVQDLNARRRGRLAGAKDNKFGYCHGVETSHRTMRPSQERRQAFGSYAATM